MRDGVREEMKIDAHFDSLQPPEYEPVKKVCPLCEREYDEDDMMYEVCDSCLTKASTFENALAYGDQSKATVEINGLFAKLLTPDQINEALTAVLVQAREFNFDAFARSVIDFLDDDTSDFAEYLIEQKKGGG